MSSKSDRLTYLTVGEIREEIAYAVGADPGRFEAGSQRGLRRNTLRRIAEQLRPEDSGLDVQQCHLPELYETVCEWVDVEYEHNAGNPWSLNKPQLKSIHGELDASDPRAVPEIRADGGSERVVCANCGEGNWTDHEPGDSLRCPFCETHSPLVFESEYVEYRVRIWKGSPDVGEKSDQAAWGEPDEIVTVSEETPHVWQDDPRYRSPTIGLDIHPEDAPATLEVYTSESVRSPPGYDNHVEKGYWDGPMEQGLTYPGDHEIPPFGCEVWGRVMFFVKEADLDE